jgi:hypothetical protein
VGVKPATTSQHLIELLGGIGMDIGMHTLKQSLILDPFRHTRFEHLLGHLLVLAAFVKRAPAAVDLVLDEL